MKYRKFPTILTTAFTLIFTTALLPAVLLAQNSAELPISELKPGSKCYALTTISGQKPQKINLKIVSDTAHPLFHEKRLILAEMQNGMPVVSGMSGSPVYCGQKLIGALSYRYGIMPLKNALAGITPIGYMRDQSGSLGRMPAPGIRSFGNALRPIEIPVSTSGANNSMDGLFGPENRGKFIFTHVDNESPLHIKQGGMGNILPGDSVVMFLATGAFSVGGMCTVAEVTEKTFSACGHPFLGEGPIELPAFKASVATTFESAYASFKVSGKVLDPVGTIVHDNAFAVEGVRELRHNLMIPVNLSVTVDSEKYDYRFDVFRHKFYTSRLIEIGTRSLLENIWVGTRLGTTRLTAKIFINGKAEPIEIYDASLITMERLQMGFMEGYADPWSKVLGKFQQTISRIQESEWGFAIEKIEISLNIWNGNRVLSYDSIAVLDQNGRPTEEIRAGDKLTVILGVRNQDSSQNLVRKFTIEVPGNLNLAEPRSETMVFMPVQLYIMSGSEYREMDPKKLPKARPDSAEEFLRVLRLNQRNPSEIFAVLVLPEERKPADAESIAFPEQKTDTWNQVENLEFLRGKVATEKRVIYLPLGAPLDDAIVSFNKMLSLKFLLN